MKWSTKAEAVTRANPEAVWALWSDVSSWPVWDHEVTSAELHGPFAVGTTGALKPKGGPQSRFILTEVHAMCSFADRSRLPFTSLEFRHALHQRGAATVIEHQVVMTGPLTFLFKRVIGSKIERGLPSAVAALARLAETELTVSR